MSIFEWPFYTGFTVVCKQIIYTNFFFFHKQGKQEENTESKADDYDIAVRQLQFEIKGKVGSIKHVVLKGTETYLRPLVKSLEQKNNFLISQPKHMLLVLLSTQNIC